MAEVTGIPRELLGSATIEPAGDFVAGSYETLRVTYWAGLHGIDESGSIKLCFRFATDQGRLQFDSPSAPNYTTIVASNDARLDYHYDPKGNVRPWDRTLRIIVRDGSLSAGDAITICMGVREYGSPGLRLQTFCEDSFEFRVLVDPIATCNFQPISCQPTIRIVPGPPLRYVGVVPTLWPAGQPFSLKLKGEDVWGNPSDQCQLECEVYTDAPVNSQPYRLIFKYGDRYAELDELVIDEPGEYRFQIYYDKELICTTNPIGVSEDRTLHLWCDLHGQSEETIGTNSAKKFFCFARELGFLDVVGHQGNDFQITDRFWNELSELSAKFNEDGKFVTLPGYEWSGNTCLGGDRNVYFPEEGRTLRRSSGALVPSCDGAGTECRHAKDLFRSLGRDSEWDVVVFAHCGGRYADLEAAHDGRFEKSVEIHSAWGTFEWILEDALELGYRVGIVANSDGHKGRPGASYPGASLFGAVGGLTALLVKDFTREAVLACLRKRHHFATTGGPNGRMLLELTAQFKVPATVYHDDPSIMSANGHLSRTAMMGDIVRLPSGDSEVSLRVSASCPVERIDLYNGTMLLETIRPYGESELGSRLRVMWSGARHRGRSRQLAWDGEIQLTGATIESWRGISFFNPEHQPILHSSRHIAWKSRTTGNTVGVDLWLNENDESSSIAFHTKPIGFQVPLAQIGYVDHIVEEPGPLPCFVRAVRLPNELAVTSLSVDRRIQIHDSQDNAIFARVSLEDGTQAWTSPIYVFRG